MAAYADTYCALVGRARLQRVALAGFEKSYSGMAGLGAIGREILRAAKSP